VLTDAVATSTLNKSSLTLSTTASGVFTQITNSSLKSQNNTNNYASTLDYNGVSVRDLANSIGTLVANNRVLVNSDITGYGGTLTDSYVTINNGANISQLTATDLTFNTISILPISSVFNFTISSSPFSFPCVITGKQYTMTPQSSFSITATSSSVNLDLPIDFTHNNLSAVLFRNNVFYPLQVSLSSARLLVLTGDFSGTQTIYFSGIIFSV
jgi:hypothetical protein